MANPPNTKPDPYEQEYAIRMLTKGFEQLADQCEKNADGIRKNREDIIIIKTRWAMIAIMCSGVGAALVKYLPLLIH